MKNTISIPSLQITVFCAFYVSCVHGYSVIFPNFVIGQQNSFLSKADKTFLYSILKGIVNIYKSYISNIEVKDEIRQYLTLQSSIAFASHLLRCDSYNDHYKRLYVMVCENPYSQRGFANILHN